MKLGAAFAGGVKRHHFKGGPKTHGQSDRHRAPGSIGAGTTPGRVLKGLKMAGHMGNVQRTVQSLEVVKVDTERNLILIKGGLPGAPGGELIIRSAMKRRESRGLHYTLDFPSLDDTNHRRDTIIRAGDFS